MNKALLQPEIQEFIRNFKGETTTLAFAGSKFPTVSVSELLVQIESRRAIAKKLPTWFATEGILYPPKLNLEQTSSEATAQYKASLVSGQALADTTGGFGIDSFYFAQKFQNVTHFETNEALVTLAKHNFNVLQQDNIVSIHADGINSISKAHYDVIYIDPSRRNSSKGKVFFLADCEPNVPEHLENVLAHCDTLLIKTSPMLDISVGLKELKYVHEIHVVALHNEVKEVLWLVRKNASNSIRIQTININATEDQIFSFTHLALDNSAYSNPKQFLYEPNAALLKSGGFQHVSEKLDVTKLQKHSHLFTSDSLQDFPGRRFIIQEVVAYNKKAMRRGIKFEKAHITTRNFPESVATLRKKWKLKEGGDIYLFFTTLENQDKIMLICAKV